MHIYVDADACPVVDIIEDKARKYKVSVTLLCDTNHVLSSAYSEVMLVGAGADAVDYKLISICHKGDIVVSQDYGVAAMALGKGAYAIHQSGKWYTNDNIDLKEEELRSMCEGKLEDENGRIEIRSVGESLFFPADSPLVTALYKAYVDVTGDTENKPMVIGGGTYAKSLKNIIAFGPEMPGIDYRIHSADEYILVSGMEESVLIYMEAIKNLLAI